MEKADTKKLSKRCLNKDEPPWFLIFNSKNN